MDLRLPYRLQQVAHVVHTHGEAPPALPAGALNRLTLPMLRQFRLLPVADQQHLINVFNLLREAGADEDTMTVGLIHDIGKATPDFQITLVDRGLHVILRRVAAASYSRLERVQTCPRLIRGLHRLANHANLGAQVAQMAGYNERVTHLVRCHEYGGDADDTQLKLLRWADDSAERF